MAIAVNAATTEATVVHKNTIATEEAAAVATDVAVVYVAARVA